MRPLALLTVSEFNPWAQGRPLCAHYAPTMSKTVSELNRWALNAPTMRPLGGHYVQKAFQSGTDGPQVRPLCAHYAPTMRPLSPFSVLELNAWVERAPTMGPLRAHYAPIMSINRFAVEPMGP